MYGNNQMMETVDEQTNNQQYFEMDEGEMEDEEEQIYQRGEEEETIWSSWLTIIFTDH